LGARGAVVLYFWSHLAVLLALPRDCCLLPGAVAGLIMGCCRGDRAA